MSNLFLPYPEYVGGRNYLILLPILAYSVSSLFIEKGKKPALVILLILVVSGLLLSLGGIIDFDESLSYRFLSFTERASYFVKYFSLISDYGITVKNRLLNNTLLYSYSSLCSSIFITSLLYLLNRKEEQGSKVLVPKAVASMIILAFLSNFYWAPINIEAYKKTGLYDRAVIVKDATLYYPEVEDIYYQTKKWKDFGYDLDETALHERWDHYVNQVRQGIISDPVGFESSLKSYDEL